MGAAYRRNVEKNCKYLPLTPQTTAVLDHDIKSDFEDVGVIDNIVDNEVHATSENVIVGDESVIDVIEEPKPKKKDEQTNNAKPTKPKKRRKSSVKDLVEKAKDNDLPEPEQDFTE